MATHKFVGDVEVTGNIKSPTTDASLYNLGAYDSVVDNGDGTVTITRQTGYIQLNGSEDWQRWYSEDKYFLLISAFPNQPSTGNKPSLAVCNIGYTYRNIWDGTPSFDICANPGSGPWTEPAIAFRNDSIDSVDDWKNFVANHPITIEYRIPSASSLIRTETVISQRPLSQLDASGEHYAKGLYDKSTNLFDMDSMRQFYYITAEDGECLYDPNYDYEYGSDIYIPVNGRYISFTFDTRPNSNYLEYVSRFYRVGCYSEAGFISRLSGVPNAATLTLSLPSGTKYIRLSINKPSTSSYNFMLVEGPSALPYVPYDAGGHITSDEADLLLSEHRKGVNLFDTVAYRGDYTGNNASTIWQTDGTAILRTTSSSDPYAWGTDVIMLPAGTYTLSFKRSIAGSATYIYIPKSGQGHYTSLGTAAGIIGAPFTVDGNTQMRIRFGGDNSGSNQDTVYSDFMLTKNDQYVPYMPYRGPIMHKADYRPSTIGLFYSNGGELVPPGLLSGCTMLCNGSFEQDTNSMVLRIKMAVWANGNTSQLSENAFQMFSVDQLMSIVKKFGVKYAYDSSRQTFGNWHFTVPTEYTDRVGYATWFTLEPTDGYFRVARVYQIDHSETPGTWGLKSLFTGTHGITIDFVLPIK